MVLGTAEKDIPTLTLYPASGDHATDCGIVICPGGGYAGLAMDHEGVQIAEWFNSIGVSAYVLKYRLPSDGYRHPVPLMDAQRAIRLVRHNAEKWNINPAKIGIIGFSAGGHLASSVGTHFEKPVAVPEAADEIGEISCRPDFMVLIYPVISMQDEITHKGSKDNLLGVNAEPAMVELLSNEKQVTPQTPPTFLVHASDDTAVVPENSVRFYQALLKANVPAELHMYLKGGHGFGIRPSAGPASQWTELCEKWMQLLDFLPK
ncbi:MAG: alpha/beta hydrolase [Phycisphaerae bacterium]|nr:alpha/beta hydrolase [Phycisphaerae bacterium]